MYTVVFFSVMIYLSGLFIKLFHIPAMLYETTKTIKKDPNLNKDIDTNTKAYKTIVTIVAILIAVIWPITYFLSFVSFTYNWFDPAKGVTQ